MNARNDWIAAARLQFSPGPRLPCAVCGKFPYITHAHHLYPLGAQFADGVEDVDQRYVWLCPNHHAMVHLIIDGDLPAHRLGRKAASIIVDLNQEEYQRFMVIIGRQAPGAI